MVRRVLASGGRILPEATSWGGGEVADNLLGPASVTVYSGLILGGTGSVSRFVQLFSVLLLCALLVGSAPICASEP